MEFFHVSDRRHEEIPHLRSPMYYSLYTFSSMYSDINKAVARDILNTGFKQGSMYYSLFGFCTNAVLSGRTLK